MTLKLMYITREPKIACIAQNAGVERIMIDLEWIGKKERQQGRDTIRSGHSLADIKKIASVLHTSDVVVRINPVHEASPGILSTAQEIEEAIENGADCIMLPYFHTANEVKTFLQLVNGRAETILLVETPEAVENLDEILKIPGIDSIHIGLNDLSIGYQKPFLFDLLADGTVEYICQKAEEHQIPCGIGGIAQMDKGVLESSLILAEHIRLHSDGVILSRSFCDASQIQNFDALEAVFTNGVRQIRTRERRIQNLLQDEAQSEAFFAQNLADIKTRLNEIHSQLSDRKQPYASSD